MATSNVTEGEVGGESGGNVIGTGNDARIALLDSIASGVDQNREDEYADVNDDDTTSPFRADRTEEEDGALDANGDPVVQPAEEKAPPENVVPEVKKFKIKVNGKDLELTEAELIERAQKVEAADEYLKLAKEKAKIAAPVPQTGPSREEIQKQQDLEDLALARALQVGTEEEALAAIRKLKSQASARPSVDSDDVSRAIDQRLDYKEALTAFKAEYKEIASDPFLTRLAADRDDQLLKSGDDRSYTERYTEIGEEIRAWMQSKVPEQVKEPTPDPIELKKAKKAAAEQAPTPASRKNEPVRPDDDDEEQTASQIINGIAKSRGGPQWMRT